MLGFVMKHRDVITGFGVMVGLTATIYGFYRFFSTPERNRAEIIESLALVVGGLFLTISAINVLSVKYPI